MPPTQLHPELSPVLVLLQEYLQQEYQERLDSIILYGSHARQEATSASDIDVLIVLQDPVDASEELKRTSQFIARLCLDHDLLISRLFMGRSRFESENSPLLRNIRSDGVAL